MALEPEAEAQCSSNIIVYMLLLSKLMLALCKCSGHSVICSGYYHIHVNHKCHELIYNVDVGFGSDNRLGDQNMMGFTIINPFITHLINKTNSYNNLAYKI